MKEIFCQFAERWGVQEEIVVEIYRMIDFGGVKYAKTSKILFQFQIKVCPRQLKYFYNKVQLEKKLGDKHPKNYSQLLKKC